MKVKLLNINANPPKKGSVSAAGYDLYSNEAGVIKPQERRLIKTGLVLQIPEGYYGRIAPRSGLALKSGIDTMAGVIDSDYRGEVGVILYNTDKYSDFIFGVGDKVAQIIFEKYYDFDMDFVANIDQTERGEGGFGSTGI